MKLTKFYVVNYDILIKSLNLKSAKKWIEKVDSIYNSELPIPQDPSQILEDLSSGEWYSAFYLEDLLPDISHVTTHWIFTEYTKNDSEKFIIFLKEHQSKIYKSLTAEIPNIFPASPNGFGFIPADTVDYFLKLLPEEDLSNKIQDVNEGLYQELRIALEKARTESCSIVVSHLPDLIDKSDRFFDF